MSKILLLLSAFLLVHIGNAVCCHAEPLPGALRRILASKTENTKAGVAIYDLSSNAPVFEYNSRQALQPASVLKIVTALTALDELGGDFVFRTQFFSDGAPSKSIETLYVRGGGDPELDIESGWSIARKLYSLGIRKVGRIVLDTSLFAETPGRQGERAYQTGSSALTFNYNSIGFHVCPRRKGESALVTPDPWEATVQVQGRVMTTAENGRAVIEEAVPEGRSGSIFPGYRASGTIGEREGCAMLYRSISRPERLFAAYLKAMLARLGIETGAAVSDGTVPANSHLLFEHHSKPLRLLIDDLNHFSTNVIGEQIVFALGSGTDGVWRRSAGLDRMTAFLLQKTKKPEDFSLVDGSGLSHLNRLSAMAIVDLLVQAERDPALQPEFENSLSITGRNGTLKRRKFGGGAVVMRGKTGTLDGVSSLAGYLVSASGRKFALAILQNGILSKEQAVKLEDDVVAVLAQS